MASGQTKNYNLNQWEAGDQVLRTEFNEDNTKIDAALAELANGKADNTAMGSLVSQVEQKASKTELENVRNTIPRIVTGTYTGDGASSRIISLGFTPKAVYVITNRGFTYADQTYSYYYGGLALTDLPVVTGKGDAVVAIVEGGFQVVYGQNGNSYLRTNMADSVYYYFAIG